MRRDRRDFRVGAGGDRHRTVGPALQEGAACRCGRRRAARRTGVRSTRPKAGGCICRPSALVEDALKPPRRRLRRLEDQDRPPAVAEDLRPPRRGALRARQLLRDHDRRQPGIRRSTRRPPCPAVYAELDLAWIEEPLPADDIDGHVRLSQSTSTPIAVGESLYSIRHFREYMAKGACNIVQVDVARIGGITPWLKVAHAAEAFDMPVCPHFLMELHVSLACAVPNGKYVEFIPQLDGLTTSPLAH